MTNKEYVPTLVINQLSDSSNYNDVLQWMADNYDDIDEILAYVGTINIFTARGVWLDLIGAIVGQTREIPNAIDYSYFGYAGQPTAAGYGQARYYVQGDPLSASSILADDEYRKVILARVARNYGDISEVGVVEGLQNIFNTNQIYINTPSGGKFTVYIGAPTTMVDDAILGELDIIPRGAGIGVSIVASGLPSLTFGYRDQAPNFAGYGVGSYAKRII